MAGGLLQLIATGIQDSPLIGEPEITFFKIVYKQYTNFSINQQLKFLGTKNFGSSNDKKLEMNGDLLFSNYFKIEIPYFQIMNSIEQNISTITTFNINSLQVQYEGHNCICANYNNSWYIIPEYEFSLSNFNSFITTIDSSSLQQKLLPEYIKVSDLGPNVNYYQVKANTVSPIINVLRIASTFFEQFWLNILASTSDPIYLNSLNTVVTFVTILNKNINNRIFNEYYSKTFYNKYNKYFNFTNNNNKTETEKYFEYKESNLISSIIHEGFDIDTASSYCILNKLNFNDYINNVLQYNSLVILYLLQNFYADNNLIFTFWLKYAVGNNNTITSNNQLNNYNLETEWATNLTLYLSSSVNVYNLKNIILNTFNNYYLITEQNILGYFNTTVLANIETMYINLHMFTMRFAKIPNQQLNFNDSYLATLYQTTATQSSSYFYNLDNFISVTNAENANYSNLKEIFQSLSQSDETLNLTPVDIINIFGYLAYQLVDVFKLKANIPKSMISTIVLWRNCIMLKLYKRYIDSYKKTFQNSKLKDYNSNRNLTLYYSIYLANPFSLNDYKSSFVELFYKTSWIGSYSISNSNMGNFIQNMFIINKNRSSSFSSSFKNSTNQFYNLNINNSYKYTLEQDNIDSKLLRIQYDNVYNINTTIILSINNIITKYTNIKQVIETVNNTSTANLLIYMDTSNIGVGSIVTLDVTYNIMVPLVLFLDTTESSITYTNNNITIYDLLTKTSDNNIDINNINNNNITIVSIPNTSALNILTIEYINNSNIIKPQIYSNQNITLKSITYYYKISYFSLETESETSNSIIQTTNTMITVSNSISINIPTSLNINVIGRKIYRTHANSTVYYLVTTINDNTSTIFNDNILDSSLTVLMPTIHTVISKIPVKFVETNNYYSLVDYNNNAVNINLNYNIVSHIYIESININYNIITNLTFNDTYVSTENPDNIPKSSSDLYYLINSNNMMDYIKLIYKYNDNTDEYYYMSPFDSSKSWVLYSVPVSNLVPNLEPFISMSTDYDYYNNKKLSDFNDYIFTKPLLTLTMLTQTPIESFPSLSSLFQYIQLPYINFYNIGFKINASSKILLENNNVNFLFPVSTQQYFIKDSTYYDSSLNISDSINNLLSPDFDEFNNDDINLNRQNLIDIQLTEFNNILNLNPDINQIITLITNIDMEIDNLYNNIFNNTIIYGSTSQTILNNINDVNNVNNIYKSKLKNLPILKYSSYDYLIYSHNALNLTKDISSVNFINGTPPVILYNPIYQTYYARNMISSDLTQYLNDVSLFFTNHIQYVSNNQDFLNITNPNNYEDLYYSKNEIKQYILDKAYNYNKIKTIKLLHPNNDTIYQMIINDQYNTTIKPTITNDTIYGEYSNEVVDNTFNKTNIVQNNCNLFDNNKFNYIGLIYIDSNHNINYENVLDNITNNINYIKTDDNTIIQFDNNLKCSNPINDIFINNPILITIGQPVSLTLTSNIMFYYQLNIILITNNILFSSSCDCYYNFNNTICYGYYDSNTDILHLSSESELDLTRNKNIVYSLDGINWNISVDVSFQLILYKVVNHYINSINHTDIYADNNNMYDVSNILVINIDSANINNGYYFYTKTSTIETYTITSSILLPSINIYSNIIKPYEGYSSIINNYPVDNYIKLLNSSNNHYIIHINEINTIPSGNYTVWLYPQNTLKLIDYPINSVSIENSLLVFNDNMITHSYYNINTNIIYYDGSSIPTNLNIITNISLLDNSMFKQNTSQLLLLRYTDNNITENIINNNITNITNTYDNTNLLTYISPLFNVPIDISSFNPDLFTVELSGNTEQLITLLISTNSNNIYYPIIIKSYQSNISIPNILYKYKSIYYKKSFVVINTNNIIHDSNNNIFIGILNTNTNDTFTAMTQDLILTNSNNNIMISIDSNFNYSSTFGIYFWKIIGLTTNNQAYSIYFWTLFSNDNSICDSYASLSNNISEPLIASSNILCKDFFNNYNLVGSVPKLLTSVNDNNSLALIKYITYPTINSITLNQIPTISQSIGIGSYSYMISYYTNSIESSISNSSSIVVTSNNSVNINLPIPTDSNVIGRKIYRTKLINGANPQYYVLRVIPNIIDTVFNDNTSDSLLLIPMIPITVIPQPNYVTLSNITTSNNKLIDGSYYYRVSYYSINQESVASNPINILTSNSAVSITIPISSSNYVLGRKIYRSTDNINFYLLVNINENISNTFVDYINTLNNFNYSIPNIDFISGPTNPILSLSTIQYNKYIQNGLYMYKMAFYTDNMESKFSNTYNITVNNNIPSISLPLSKDIIGRKIYRTHVNNSTFYLLAVIQDNTTTVFNDNISDTYLTNLAPNYITPNIPNIPTLSLISIDDMNIGIGVYQYKISSISDNMESSCSDIISITTNENNAVSINGSGKIYRTKVNENTFYFLSMCTNTFIDNISDNNLIEIDPNIVVNTILPPSPILSLVDNVTTQLITPGTYKYQLTFVSNNIESPPSDIFTVIINNNMYIQLTIPQLNDMSCNIYRTKNNGSVFYLLDSTSSNSYNDNINDNKLKILYNNILSAPIFNQQISLSPVENQSILVGRYLYKCTYFSTNLESIASNYQTIQTLLLNQVNITLPISGNSNVIGRNIYRTKVDSSTFYLLTTIYNNSSTSFIDNISDNNLGPIYNVTSIDRPDFTKPVSLYNLGIIPQKISVGLYQYVMTYYSSTQESEITSIYPAISNQNSIAVGNSSQVIITLPISSDNNVIGRNIYRTSVNESTNLYLLANIQDNKTTTFNDNISDSMLPLTVYNPVKHIIAPTWDSTSIALTNLTLIIQNINPGIYNYQFTYFSGTISNNKVTIIQESLPSPGYSATVTNGTQVSMTVPKSSDPSVIGRNIYRTKNNGNTYYLLTTQYSNVTIADNTTTTFYDNMNDFQLSVVQPTIINIAKPIFTSSPLSIQSELSQPMAVGTYFYQMTYSNSAFSSSTNYNASDPSYAYSIIITDSTSAINITYTPNTNFYLNIYRTKVNQTNQYYLITTINPNSSGLYTDFASDNSLTSVGTTQYYITAPTFSFNPTSILNLGTIPQAIGNGLYYYKISYYNNSKESENSNFINISITLNHQVALTKIPISSDTSVTGRKIYRTLANTNTYYLLADIKDNITTSYIDNTADSKLTILNPNIKFLTPPTNLSLSLENLKVAQLIGIGLYSYIIKYSTSFSSDRFSINVPLNQQVEISLPNFNDYRIQNISIYRTKVNYNTYYLLTTILTPTTIFIDNISDTSLTILYNSDLPIPEISYPLSIRNLYSNTQQMDPGTYSYIFSFSSNTSESQYSNPYSINVLKNTMVNINLPTTNDSRVTTVSIYRFNHTSYYLLARLPINTANYIDNTNNTNLTTILKSQLQQPVFNNPGQPLLISPIISTLNSKYNYKIVLSTINGDSMDSISNSIITNNKVVKIELPKLNDSNIIGYKIYRTKLNGSIYYLLAKTSTSTYYDYATDNTLQLKMPLYISSSNHYFQYKYYTNTKSLLDYDYNIMENNFNSVNNIKPTIEYYNYIDIQSQIINISNIPLSILNNAKYYILISTQVLVIPASSFTNNIYVVPSIINTASLYWTMNTPFYIYNPMTIRATSNANLYEMSNYTNNYLEVGEIIFIDNYIFMVNGLNITTNYYELQIISSSSYLRYNYNGYYTLGTYLNKKNKILPIVDMNTLLTYKHYIDLKTGTSYYDGESICFTIEDTTLTDVFVFSEPSIQVKLYYNSKNLYLFDNYIQLKNKDKLIYLNNIYEIFNIRDNIIYLTTELQTDVKSGFITMILPYQPFTDINNSNHSEGYIYLTSSDDSLNISLTKIANSRSMNVNYNKYFDNTYIVPIDNNNILGDNYSIQLSLLYIGSNSFTINNTNILTNYKFYYMQPVFYAGNYNNITNINGNTITLLNQVNLQLNTNIDMIFSPSIINTNNYYTYYKFTYNFNINHYNILNLAEQLNVYKYTIKQNKLININQETIQYNSPIPTISGYTLIYFYDNLRIGNNGVIVNSDTIHDSYHLLLEDKGDTKIVHLCKIIYPNQLYLYTTINLQSKFYLDKVIHIYINTNNEFTYGDMNIIIQQPQLHSYNLPVTIISQYQVKIVSYPTFVNNNYVQTISFVNNTTNTDTIYLDPNSNTSYVLTNNNNSYQILSPTLLQSNIIYIYTKKTNYIQSITTSNYSWQSNLINHSDKNIENILNNSSNIEYNLFNISITNGSTSASNQYIYQPIISDSNFSLNMSYSIYQTNINVTSIIQVQTIIITNNKIYNDTLLYTSNNITCPIYISNKINPAIVYDSSSMFNDVKQLLILLENDTIINPIYIYNNVKPWATWSLIQSIPKVSLFSSPLTFINKGYVVIINNIVSFVKDNSYNYITNDEILMLTTFLNTRNNVSLLTTLRSIETAIFNNIPNWISSVYFFRNVQTIVNDFLKYNNFNARFDGNNIIINNSSIYLSNEFNAVIDPNNNNQYNRVYRPINNNINREIGNFILKTQQQTTYGVNIINLLKYLVKLGKELHYYERKILLTLSEMPNYNYLSPLKFLINFIWSNNNISILNQDFNNNIIVKNLYKPTTYILNSFVYNNNKILNFGLESIDDMNISNLTMYNPNLLLPVSVNDVLITEPIFPYQINLSYLLDSSQTFNANIRYSINFLNGVNIGNIENIINPTQYPNQLNFYSQYDITNDDFILIKQVVSYSFIASYMGTLYTLMFNQINHNIIDSIYFQSQQLVIESINNNNINIIIPSDFESYILNTTDIFTIMNNYTIIKTNIMNNKQYLTFYNTRFNFLANQTFIKINNINYPLKYDNMYYIDSYDNVSNMDCTIFTIISPSNIINNNKKIYKFILDNKFINEQYTIYNKTIIIADDFILSNKGVTNLTPSYINLYDDTILWLYFDNNININNYNTLTYANHLGEYLPNEIVSITSQNTYLYYINQIPTLANKSNIVLVNINDFNPSITFNNNNIVTTKTYQKNNTTFIELPILYNISTLNNMIYYVHNYWTGLNMIYNTTKKIVSFTLPFDFTINSSNNVYYALNNVLLNVSTFEINNNTLSFPLLNYTNNSTFHQYIVNPNKCSIYIPLLNTKYLIQYKTIVQFDDNMKFYITPYSGLGSLYDNNLYTLIINESIVEAIENIGIILDGINICKVFSQRILNNNTIFIVSSSLTIDNSMYEIEINSVLYNADITFYQNGLQLASYCQQTSGNSIELYMSHINNYNISDEVTMNRYYLIGQNNMTISNLYKINSYNQLPCMQPIITTNNITNITYNDPEWTSPFKFFDYIQFYIGDNMIEELTEYTYNIDYNLYFTDEQRKQFDKITKIRLTGKDKWEFTLPLTFWFHNNPGLALPLIALPNIEISIKYKIKDLSKLISLSEHSIQPQNKNIKIYLDSNTILLDTEERELFGTYSHEYIVERYKSYSTNYINTVDSLISKPMTGLVKDIIIIARPINNPTQSCYQKIDYSYDPRYKYYMIASNFYTIYISNGYYTSDQQKLYSNDFVLFKSIDSELTNPIVSQRIVLIKKVFSNSSNFNLRFFLFFMDKFQSSQTLNKKINNLLYYLKYMHKIKKNIKEISPIQSMTIQVNGMQLLAPRNYNYFTSVIPFIKFKNTLPIGYYVYSFSLEPLENQHSGHLNFTNFDQVVFDITSDNTVLTEPYEIITTVKDYNIIRIMSGMGALAWI